MRGALISVIVPAFNAENKIETCISALLAQSYKKIEIFVVDDGSTDKTVALVSEFVDRHPNVHLLKQRRKGPGAAKNLASKKAKGTILVFVDSDEYPRKDYIEKLTFSIRQGKAKTAIGAWYVARPESPWARCRFKDSHALRKHAVRSGVFRAIEKSFFQKLRGFDTTKGYSDDRIPNNEKRSRIDSAIFDHDVDSSLSELYEKRKWIGSSIMKNPKPLKFKIKLVFGIMGSFLLIYSLVTSALFFWVIVFLLILPIIFQTLEKVFFYKDERLIFYYPIYFFVVSYAMIIGLLKPVYRN